MKLRHMKKRLRHYVKGGTTRLVSPELARQDDVSAALDDGVLRQRTRELQLPEALVEAADTKPSRVLPGPFMTTILILAIVFISIIAWFVSRMPE